MSDQELKYKHLLSPYRIGSHVIKNRMIATASMPFLNLGPERYPSEPFILNHIYKAKSGAGIVVFGDVMAPNRPPRPMDTMDPGEIMEFRKNRPNEFNPEKGWLANSGRPICFDILTGAHQNILSNMVEAMHFYGAKALLKLRVESLHGFDVSTSDEVDRTEIGSGGAMKRGKAMTEEQLLGIIEEYGFQASLAKEIGFDGVYVHMAYGGPVTARLLSPLTNRRTDRFSVESYENRTRFCVMALDKIKQRCGTDFLTYGIISGEEPEGGYTLEDLLEFARRFQGRLDLLHLKGQRNDLSHPTGFTSERYPFLHYAEEVKKAAPGLAVVANGGFNDLDDCEQVIASGKADFIGTGRAWICNEDYGKLAYQGRNEDVVPCLRCNRCHVSSYYRPWTSVCAVNPTWGFEHRIDHMLEPPKRTGKIAIVGGGVAGMEAALTARKLGHQVTLYEKSASLGGLLKLYSAASFKWPYRDYLEFMIRKVNESGAEIRLNTNADADTIRAGGFDGVIVAIGAQPAVPEIPGIHDHPVTFVPAVYGREDQLAQDVVIVGGGQSGVEAGMHLAELGHSVTVLEKFTKLAKDAPPLQFYSMFEEAWEKLPNFKGIVGAQCTAIREDGVVYVDASGAEHTVRAGSVIIAAGMKSKTDEAFAFGALNRRMLLIGDCHTVSDIQVAVRSGYAAAHTLLKDME